MTSGSPQSPRESAAPPSTPHHRRTVVVEVSDAAEGLIEVAGRMRDERPWATDPLDLPVVHDLGLAVTVSLADFVVRAVRVDFWTYPHAECIDIAEAHQALVGVTLGRDRTPPSASHSEDQSAAPTCGSWPGPWPPRCCRPRSPPGSASVDAMTRSTARLGAMLPLIADTCHVWAVGGVAEQKLERGWRPGSSLTPIPAVADLE